MEGDQNGWMHRDVGCRFSKLRSEHLSDTSTRVTSVSKVSTRGDFIKAGPLRSGLSNLPHNMWEPLCLPATSAHICCVPTILHGRWIHPLNEELLRQERAPPPEESKRVPLSLTLAAASDRGQEGTRHACFAEFPCTCEHVVAKSLVGWFYPHVAPCR